MDPKKEIVKIAHLLYQKNLCYGKGGNISIRFNRKIYIKASGISMGLMDENDVVTEDSILPKPSIELKFHRKIYEIREDVNGIIHTHSPYSTAFALSNLDFPKGITPEAEFNVCITKYAPAGSDELAKYVGRCVKNADVVLLKNHGVVTVGRTLLDAFLKLESFENICKYYVISRMMKNL